jgi:hypothetical protein
MYECRLVIRWFRLLLASVILKWQPLRIARSLSIPTLFAMSVPGTAVKQRWSYILTLIIWRGCTSFRSDLCMRQEPLTYVITRFSLFNTSHLVIDRKARALSRVCMRPVCVNTFLSTCMFHFTRCKYVLRNRPNYNRAQISLANNSIPFLYKFFTCVPNLVNIFFFLIFRVAWDGFPWYMAINGPLSQPWIIDERNGTFDRMTIGRGNRSTRRKPVPVPLYPS